METELTAMGYSILRESVPPHFIENIRRELYVKPLENPNFDFGDSKEYPVFRMSKTRIKQFI